jgi:hypothetical protein
MMAEHLDVMMVVSMVATTVIAMADSRAELMVERAAVMKAAVKAVVMVASTELKKVA